MKVKYNITTYKNGVILRTKNKRMIARSNDKGNIHVSLQRFNSDPPDDKKTCEFTSIRNGKILITEFVLSQQGAKELAMVLLKETKRFEEGETQTFVYESK